MNTHRLKGRWHARLVGMLAAACLLHAAATLPAYATSELAGWVFIDRNNDGVLNFANDPDPEYVIGEVEVKLFMKAAEEYQLIATTETDPFGRFLFSGLSAGTYKLQQTQPVGYVDGLDTLGFLQSLNNQPLPGTASPGIAFNDYFQDIVLPNNVRGDYYTFGERGMSPGYVSKRYLLGTPPTMNFGTPDPDPDPIPEPTSAMLAIAAIVGGIMAQRSWTKFIPKG